MLQNLPKETFKKLEIPQFHQLCEILQAILKYNHMLIKKMYRILSVIHILV